MSSHATARRMTSALCNICPPLGTVSALALQPCARSPTATCSIVSQVDQSFLPPPGQPLLPSIMTPTTAIELLITDCRFVSNRGGALRLRGRRVQATIQSCTFSDNGEATLSAGGAIFTDSARVEIVASMFLSNVAEVGGAIACASGTVSLTRCEFRDNAATMQGAAISATGTLNLNVGGSRFEDNIAGVRGSAIDISKAMVRLKRSEISAPDCSSVSQVCVSDAGWLDVSATSFSLPSACAAVQVCLLACAALLACVGAAVVHMRCACAGPLLRIARSVQHRRAKLAVRAAARRSRAEGSNCRYAAAPRAPLQANQAIDLPPGLRRAGAAQGAMRH